MIGILIPVLILATGSQAQNLNPSPCRGIFKYEPVGSEPGRWHGIIYLYTDTTLHALRLDIELDSKAELLNNNIGEISTRDNMNYRIENTQFMIKPGPPFEVDIFVKYNVLKRAPKLQSIKFNGMEICNANNLQPVDILPDNTDVTNRTHTNILPTRATTEEDITFSAPPLATQPVEMSSVKSTPTSVSGASEEKCGKVINEVPLIVQGTNTLEGQWPWQIALYETMIANSMFICGGTLLSHRHVLTAAHCTTRSHSKRLKEINTFMVLLGKHNLRTTTFGVQVRYVEQVLVNPDYNPTNYYNDISIITLLERVAYTTRVQPACLWPENLIPQSNVIGKKGSVVGWGLDITGVHTEELNLVRVRVVDTETCLRSKNEFYNRLTSNHTFCAGNDDGTGPCNGDSGGAMMFKLDDDSWYIRGVVSVAVSTPNGNRCDPNYYVIFTDIAQLLPWIKSNVFDY